MHNPFRSLKYLPWPLLLLSAGLTVLVATAIDILLRVAVSMLPVLAGLLLSSPLIPMILTIAVPFGVGALAIFLTRQFFSSNSAPSRHDLGAGWLRLINFAWEKLATDDSSVVLTRIWPDDDFDGSSRLLYRQPSLLALIALMALSETGQKRRLT